eukprot:1871933-Pyramimonas_sp.AAC.1
MPERMTAKRKRKRGCGMDAGQRHALRGAPPRCDLRAAAASQVAAPGDCETTSVASGAQIVAQ